MADIVVTPAKVGLVDPIKAITFMGIAATAMDAGTPVYINTTTGKVTKADASSAGTAGVRGITVTSVGAGMAVTCLKVGALYGFTLAGDYDAAVYLSNTEGALSDGAGTVSVVVGRIVAMTDSSATKVLWVSL